MPRLNTRVFAVAQQTSSATTNKIVMCERLMCKRGRLAHVHTIVTGGDEVYMYTLCMMEQVEQHN